MNMPMSSIEQQLMGKIFKFEKDESIGWNDRRLARASWVENHKTRGPGERDVYVECSRK